MSAASTFTRAEEETLFGTVIDCDPSFGVFASRVIGKVNPPSVESRILTFAQFTGATLVLAIFQVTVWLVPMAHVTAVFGKLTVNGPAVPLTVTTIRSSEV